MAKKSLEISLLRAFWRLRLLLVLFAGSCFAFAAAAGPLDSLYDDAEIAELGGQYQRGWATNFENVFKPVFTDEERAKFANVEFLTELRVPDNEPFAYLGGGDTVLVSAASLRFLEDLVMAYTWTNSQGLSLQTIADYLMMLRNWDEARGRPPKPWDVLCIPADAWSREPFAEQALRVLDSAAAFMLLHEYGHVLHQHPGNQGVPPEESRASEEAADAFALDIFARVGDVPLGMTIPFFTMSYLHEIRSQFQTDDEYMRTLAARTHPISPQRLLSLAQNLTEQSEVYGRKFPAGRMAALAVALDVSEIAMQLADPEVQGLSSRIGKSVEPQDLGPRPNGRHLAAPCGARPPTGEPFDGTLHGKMTIGPTDFDIDTVLVREGDTVTGSYSFGAGFGRIEGAINGSTLDYRWSLAPDSGAASVTFDGSVYRGTWGAGTSAEGGGIIEMSAE